MIRVHRMSLQWGAEMTKRSLHASQFNLVEIIEELGFGRIEQISIRGGEPCFEHATQIVAEIKLGSEPETGADPRNPDLTLKSEFERLFQRLSLVRNGLVDIEVRHSTPFRLIVRRFCKELGP